MVSHRDCDVRSRAERRRWPSHRRFASIHAALGLRCHQAADGTYTHSALHSSPIVTSIDRYAVVGQRKRDGIHPFWNAQFAIVQLMLNHMCP